MHARWHGRNVGARFTQEVRKTGTLVASIPRADVPVPCQMERSAAVNPGV